MTDGAQLTLPWSVASTTSYISKCATKHMLVLHDPLGLSLRMRLQRDGWKCENFEPTDTGWLGIWFKAKDPKVLAAQEVSGHGQAET